MVYLKMEPPEDFEGEAAEPDTKKLKAIAEEFEAWFLTEHPELFITRVLKFLTIYELDALYKLLSKQLRQWWDVNNVWFEICRTEMKGEFRKFESYVVHLVPKGEVLNYKWLLFAWECYAAAKNDFTRRFEVFHRDEGYIFLFEVLKNFQFYVNDDNILYVRAVQDERQYYEHERGRFAHFLRLAGNRYIFYGSFRDDRLFFRFVYVVFREGFYIKRKDLDEHGDPLDNYYPKIRSELPLL